MNSHIVRTAGRLSLLALVSVVAACAQTAVAPRAALSATEISAVVAAPDRTAADRDADARRKPLALLAFVGVHQSDRVLDVVAGGGYTTELMARAVGPTGVVYAQAQPRDPNRPVAPGARVPGAAVAERDARLRASGAAAAPISVTLQPLTDPAPPAVAQGQLDVVTLIYNYHDLGSLGEGRMQMNRSIFRALKPGGVYVVADHAGRPGTGISESRTLHRVEEVLVRAEIESAGFKLVNSGEFLRNPADPRDKETPDDGQAKDGFILKFVKPAL